MTAGPSAAPWRGNGMKPAFLLALVFAGVACSTAPREYPLGDEDPDLIYEQRWKDLTSPIQAEIKSSGQHPWAGEYWCQGIQHLYMAPRSGWASRECGCEPPNELAWGTVIESKKGLEFRYANGARLSDDDFDDYILCPIQSMHEWAKWEEGWLHDADAARRANVLGWTSYLESVLTSAIAGRK